MFRPHLNIKGKGRPFVWMHGMLNSVESDSVYSLIDFDRLAQLVSVVRYNACNKSVDGDYSWDAMTNELVSLADSQNYETMILGGSSMGAGTAIHFAVKFPERVKALVLVTPPLAWEMRDGVKELYRKIAAKVGKDNISAFLRMIIQTNQDPPDFYEQKFSDTRKRLLDFRLSFEPQYYSQIYLGGANSDLPAREQIGRIDVPTLIVAIPDDENHPVKMAQQLNSLVANSELVLISDYQDYLNLQNKVQEFIRRIA